MAETYEQVLIFGRHTLANGSEGGRSRRTILIDYVYGPPTLGVVAVTPNSVPENTVNGTVVGTLSGLTSGSTPTLTDDAGGRFSLNGLNQLVVANSTLLNYESATTHNITVREALTGATNTPNDTVIPIGVTNVAEAATLTDITGTFVLAEDAAANDVAGAIGNIQGATLSLTDDAGGRVAILGTDIVRGATALDYDLATSHSFTIRKVLADSSNTPFDTVLSLIVTVVEDAMPSTEMEFALSYVAGGPPIYDINFVDIHAGDYLNIQQTDVVTGGFGDYTTPTLDITHQMLEVEVAAEAVDPALLAADGYTAPGAGDWGERCRWQRDGVPDGPWTELTGTISSSTTALVASTGPDKSTNFIRVSAYEGSLTANEGANARIGCRFDAAPVTTQFHAELVLDGAAANQTVGIGCCAPWNGSDAAGTGTNINTSFPVAMPGFSTAMNGFSASMVKGSTNVNLTINGVSTTNFTLGAAAANGDALIIEVDTAINKVWLWHRTAAGVATLLNSGGTTLTSKIPSSYILFLRGACQGGTATEFHANIDPADFLETPSSGFSYYA